MTNKMPPELLERFKKKQEGGDEEQNEKRKSARDKSRKVKEMRQKGK